jgi:hypothetical protein
MFLLDVYSFKYERRTNEGSSKASQVKVLTEGAKRNSTSLCLLAIPVLTASLGSITDTLTLTGDVLTLTIWSLTEGLDS